VHLDLLAELSDLFSREAIEADMRGDADEADRLWDVADELHERRDRHERKKETHDTFVLKVR